MKICIGEQSHTDSF